MGRPWAGTCDQRTPPTTSHRCRAQRASPPLGHVPGRLQEPRVVVLLQDVLGLVDEDRGALQTLPAVGDLLGQLPQLHHLREQQREAAVLKAST